MQIFKIHPVEEHFALADLQAKCGECYAHLNENGRALESLEKSVALFRKLSGSGGGSGEFASALNRLAECLEKSETEQASEHLQEEQRLNRQIEVRTEALNMYMRVYGDRKSKRMATTGVTAEQRAEMRRVVEALIALHGRKARLIERKRAAESHSKHMGKVVAEALARLHREAEQNNAVLELYRDRLGEIDARKVDLNFAYANCIIS
jgi:tetratricopeptide (TPR) repeat protein